MREIKFRAWDKDRMVKGFELFEDNSAYRGAIPMQFTGLLDKNGKEIYESDIIETEHGAKGICKWNDKEAKFDFDCSEPYWSHPIYGMSGEKQVIGNVYES